MKPLSAVIAAALCTAGLAQAQEATPLPIARSASTLDRAAVLAEVRSALAADRHVWGNEGPDAFARSAGSRDRAAVRSEAIAGRLSSAELLRERLDHGM